jgi:CarboxypepD_reg-like domain
MKLFISNLLFLLIALCVTMQISLAQTVIKGEVFDFTNNEPLSNINVRNIFTLQGMTIGTDGKFSIEVKKGQLIELSKLGYKTIRIRIQNEKEPAFYRLIMSKVPLQLREVDIKGKALDFVKDSVRYREIYDIVLRKEHKQDVDMRSMPLAMLSKKNREEWAFQEMYEKWERDKYINFTFNERLIGKITYLKDEDLTIFMQQFRPSYEFLRTASSYEYLDYIKHCYGLFRKTNLR